MEKEIKYLIEILRARYNPVPKGCGDDTNADAMKEVIFNSQWRTADDAQKWVAMLSIGKPETCAWITFVGKGMLIQEAIDELSSKVLCDTPDYTAEDVPIKII